MLNIEGSLVGKVSLDGLRRDHILMYAILGDPALKLHLPYRLHGAIPRGPGGWSWHIDRPEDADRLYVSFRPAGRKLPQPGRLADSDIVSALAERAGAVFDFEPLAELTADVPWQGTIALPGVIRFVATAPGGIYAAAIELKEPR